MENLLTGYQVFQASIRLEREKQEKKKAAYIDAVLARFKRQYEEEKKKPTSTTPVFKMNVDQHVFECKTAIANYLMDEEGWPEKKFRFSEDVRYLIIFLEV